jgi:hypothetical protein
MPTSIDYKKIRQLIKKQFTKVFIGGLILYAVYLNILYSSVSADNHKFLNEYFRMHNELDSLKGVNRKLTEKINSFEVYK